MSLLKNVLPPPCSAPAAGISSCGTGPRVTTIWPLAAAAARMMMRMGRTLRMRNLLGLLLRKMRTQILHPDGVAALHVRMECLVDFTHEKYEGRDPRVGRRWQVIRARVRCART